MKRRLELALVLIEKEKTFARLKHDINKDVEKKVQEQHRKFLLNEQVLDFEYSSEHFFSFHFFMVHHFKFFN